MANTYRGESGLVFSFFFDRARTVWFGATPIFCYGRIFRGTQSQREILKFGSEVSFPFSFFGDDGHAGARSRCVPGVGGWRRPELAELASNEPPNEGSPRIIQLNSTSPHHFTPSPHSNARRPPRRAAPTAPLHPGCQRKNHERRDVLANWRRVWCDCRRAGRVRSSRIEEAYRGSGQTRKLVYRCTVSGEFWKLPPCRILTGDSSFTPSPCSSRAITPWPRRSSPLA